MTQCCIQERHLPTFETGDWQYIPVHDDGKGVGGCEGDLNEANAEYTRLPPFVHLWIVSRSI